MLPAKMAQQKERHKMSGSLMNEHTSPRFPMSVLVLCENKPPSSLSQCGF